MINDNPYYNTDNDNNITINNQITIKLYNVITITIQITFSIIVIITMIITIMRRSNNTYQ